MAIRSVLRIGVNNDKLALQRVELKRWSDSALVKSRIVSLRTVHPNHMIYEVVTTFSSDLVVRGNRWSSGRKTFLLDAETGRVIAIQTLGNQTANAGILRARLAAQHVVNRRGFTFTAAELARLRMLRSLKR